MAANSPASSLVVRALGDPRWTAVAHLLVATSAHPAAWPRVRVGRRIEPARGARCKPASRELQAAERRVGAGADATEPAAKQPPGRRDPLRRDAVTSKHAEVERAELRSGCPTHKDQRTVGRRARAALLLARSATEVPSLGRDLRSCLPSYRRLRSLGRRRHVVGRPEPGFAACVRTAARMCG